MPEFLSSSTFLISAVAVLAVLLILILGLLKGSAGYGLCHFRAGEKTHPNR